MEPDFADAQQMRKAILQKSLEKGRKSLNTGSGSRSGVLYTNDLQSFTSVESSSPTHCRSPGKGRTVDKLIESFADIQRKTDGVYPRADLSQVELLKSAPNKEGVLSSIIQKRLDSETNFAEKAKETGRSPEEGFAIPQVVKYYGDDKWSQVRVMGMIEDAKNNKRSKLESKSYVGYYTFRSSNDAQSAIQTKFKPRFEVIFKPYIYETADGMSEIPLDPHRVLRKPWAFGGDESVGVKEKRAGSYPRYGDGGAPQSIIKSEDNKDCYLIIDRVYEFVFNKETGQEEKVLLFEKKSPAIMKID